jgi:hypothetical protein
MIKPSDLKTQRKQLKKVGLVGSHILMKNNGQRTVEIPITQWFDYAIIEREKGAKARLVLRLLNNVKARRLARNAGFDESYLTELQGSKKKTFGSKLVLSSADVQTLRQKERESKINGRSAVAPLPTKVVAQAKVKPASDGRPLPMGQVTKILPTPPTATVMGRPPVRAVRAMNPQASSVGPAPAPSAAQSRAAPMPPRTPSPSMTPVRRSEPVDLDGTPTPPPQSPIAKRTETSRDGKRTGTSSPRQPPSAAPAVPAPKTKRVVSAASAMVRPVTTVQPAGAASSSTELPPQKKSNVALRLGGFV